MRADRRTALGCWHAALAAEGALVAKGVCGVSGQEPGRQRAWAAEAIAVLKYRELQEAAQRSPLALFFRFSAVPFKVSALSPAISFRLFSSPDGQLYRKRHRKDFFQNKRGGFNNAFALTAFFTADIFQGDGGQGNGCCAAVFAAKRGAEADFAAGYVKRVDDDFFAA